jgi:hypothetical protein
MFHLCAVYYYCYHYYFATQYTCNLKSEPAVINSYLSNLFSTVYLFDSVLCVVVGVM